MLRQLGLNAGLRPGLGKLLGFLIAVGMAVGGPAGAVAQIDAPSGPEPTPEPTIPVDWPDLPETDEAPLVVETEHFEVRVARDSAVLVDAAERWAPTLESLRAILEARLGLELPAEVTVMFAPTYGGQCPARGLAQGNVDEPLMAVFMDGNTTDEQIRGVLAHELVHILTFNSDFVGDGVLTEGIANWAAGRFMLDWQGIESWDAATRNLIADRRYVSVTKTNPLVPDPGEDCLERRDRVYNARASFTGWLVETAGLETVLEMPRTGGGEGQRPRPDYEAATGFTLPELETLWLAEITGTL